MSLSLLPPELLHKILHHLDILSLLSFSLTSATNYTHHLHALHTLDLAVFPKKVHALIVGTPRYVYAIHVCIFLAMS